MRGVGDEINDCCTIKIYIFQANIDQNYQQPLYKVNHHCGIDKVSFDGKLSVSYPLEILTVRLANSYKSSFKTLRILR